MGPVERGVEASLPDTPITRRRCSHGIGLQQKHLDAEHAAASDSPLKPSSTGGAIEVAHESAADDLHHPLFLSWDDGDA